MEYLLSLTIAELKMVKTIIGTQEDTIRGIPIYPKLESLQKKVKQCLAFVKTQDVPLNFTERLLSLEIEDLEALDDTISGELFFNTFPNAAVRLPEKVRYTLNFAKYQAQANITYIYKGENPDTEKYSPFIGGCSLGYGNELCAILYYNHLKNL